MEKGQDKEKDSDNKLVKSMSYSSIQSDRPCNSPISSEKKEGCIKNEDKTNTSKMFLDNIKSDKPKHLLRKLENIEGDEEIYHSSKKPNISGSGINDNSGQENFNISSIISDNISTNKDKADEDE
ncbi:MAG: hypothetical protein MHPSP_001927, partial [Paramarteilia canceri]